MRVFLISEECGWRQYCVPLLSLWPFLGSCFVISQRKKKTSKILVMSSSIFYFCHTAFFYVKKKDTQLSWDFGASRELLRTTEHSSPFYVTEMITALPNNVFKCYTFKRLIIQSQVTRRRMKLVTRKPNSVNPFELHTCVYFLMPSISPSSWGETSADCKYRFQDAEVLVSQKSWF